MGVWSVKVCRESREQESNQVVNIKKGECATEEERVKKEETGGEDKTKKGGGGAHWAPPCFNLIDFFKSQHKVCFISVPIYVHKRYDSCLPAEDLAQHFMKWRVARLPSSHG